MKKEYKNVSRFELILLGILICATITLGIFGAKKRNIERKAKIRRVAVEPIVTSAPTIQFAGEVVYGKSERDLVLEMRLQDRNRKVIYENEQEVTFMPGYSETGNGSVVSFSGYLVPKLIQEVTFIEFRLVHNSDVLDRYYIYVER